MDEKLEHILAEAVTAICLADKADLEMALWQIVKIAGGEEAYKLLEENESAANKKYALGFYERKFV